MADQLVPMTFRLGYTPGVEQDYATKQARRDDEAWQRMLLQEKAAQGEEAGPAAPEKKPEGEKPSALKVAVETGAMASADAARNMVDGLRAIFGMGPSPAVAKAFNVPEVKGEEAANPLEGAKKIVMNGLLQFGFSPVSGTLAGARQALENSAPDVAQTALASGFAAAGIRGILEGKSYASLPPEDQARYLAPLTVGEVIESVGPMLAGQAAGPAFRGAKKAGKAVGKAVKEAGPALMSQRGAIGPEPPMGGAGFEAQPGGGATKPPEAPPAAAAAGAAGEARVNLGRIGASDTVKQVIADLNRAQSEKLAEHRAVKPHEKTVEGSRGALTLGEALDLDHETAMLTAEQGTALRDLYNGAATHLTALKRAAEKGDANAASQAYAAAIIAGRLALLDEAVGRNVARTLEARKIESSAQRGAFDPHDLAVMAQSLEGAAEMDGAAFLKRLDALPTRTARRTYLAQLTNFLQAGRLTRDVVSSLWTHNLLTNPVTHAANIGGTTLTTLAEVPERFTGEIVHRLFSSNPDGIQRGETAALLRGLMEGVYGDGIRFAGRAMRGEDPFGGKGAVERGPRIKAEEYGWDPNTVPGRAVDVLGATMDNLPAFWALRVEDAYFKGINFQMEIKALAVREARARGFAGAELAAEIAKLEKKPTMVMIEQAIDAANLRTLNQELGPAGQAFQKWVNEVPGGRVVFPFVRTPTNALKWFGQRAPILAQLSAQNWADMKAGGAAREMAIARQIVGAVAAGAIAYEVFQGNITGPGPGDKNLKRDMRAAGLQDNAVRVGDSLYSYSRLDPVGAYIGLVAGAAEIMAQVDDDEQLEHLADAIILAGGQTMTNKTYLTGLANVLEAIKNPGEKSHAWASGMARSLVPAGMRQLTRTIEGGAIHDAQTLLDEVKTGVPGYSTSVPVEINPVTGEDVRMPPGWGPDMLSPVLVSKMGDDPVLLEIIRQGVSVPPIPKVIGGASPAGWLSVAPERATVGIKLTGLERRRWGELQTREVQDGDGRTLHERLTAVVQGPEYARLSDGPDGSKADLIRDTVRVYRQQARLMLLAEDPELARDLEAHERAKIAAKLPKDHPQAQPVVPNATPAVRRLLNAAPTGAGGQLPATLSR